MLLERDKLIKSCINLQDCNLKINMFVMLKLTLYKHYNLINNYNDSFKLDKTNLLSYKVMVISERLRFIFIQKELLPYFILI